MPAVRDESDQKISWDIFEDGLNFLSFNFLGIFVFVAQEVHEISQFSISAILKHAN